MVDGDGVAYHKIYLGTTTPDDVSLIRRPAKYGADHFRREFIMRKHHTESKSNAFDSLEDNCGPL